MALLWIFMALLWYYYGIIMALLWRYHGIIMALLWHYYGIIMDYYGIIMDYHCIIMALLWHCYGIIMALLWIIMALLWHYYGIIMDNHGIIMVLLWHYNGIIVALSWHYYAIIVALLWHYYKIGFSAETADLGSMDYCQAMILSLHNALSQTELGSNQERFDAADLCSWANYNHSLTWIKAIWGWFPLRARSELVIIYPGVLLSLPLRVKMISPFQLGWLEKSLSGNDRC